MNDFFNDIENLRPLIPTSVYKPFKRCQSCHSVYLSETHCEACGRSLSYHIIGEPFSAKSFYGIKERYCNSLPFFVRSFPFFENIESLEALLFIRQLTKRFDDLLEGFTQEGMIPNDSRRFFYIEMLALIDTLYLYGTEIKVLESKIEESLAESSPLLFQALLEDELWTKRGSRFTKGSWSQRILEKKIFGVLRLDFLLKASIFSATAVAVAYMSFELVSLQVGK